MEANQDALPEVYSVGHIVESQVRLKDGHYSIVRCLDSVHSVLGVRFAHLQNVRRGCGYDISPALIESTSMARLGPVLVPSLLLVL